MPKPPQHLHLRIWDAVCKIPEGRVSTYGAIARKCRIAGQPRLVGYALHNLPPGAEVPWHRVINSRGMISLPGESGRRQQTLLEAEGIFFVRKKIDLAVYGWPSSRRTR